MKLMKFVCTRAQHVYSQALSVCLWWFSFSKRKQTELLASLWMPANQIFKKNWNDDGRHWTRLCGASRNDWPSDCYFSVKITISMLITSPNAQNIHSKLWCAVETCWFVEAHSHSCLSLHSSCSGEWEYFTDFVLQERFKCCLVQTL